MQIDRQTLAKLEKLSHLKIAEEREEMMLKHLTEILEYVENLNELDTDGIDSYFSTLEGGTPMREDIPSTDSDVSKIILEHAPQSRDDYFIVPAIIE